MPTVSNATPPKLQFFDANGDPLVGGKLYSYAAGTTTPLATYTDSTGGVANTNPVVLDSRGEASVWLAASLYKLKLTTSTDVEVWTVDNLNGADQATLAQLAASGGAALVGFIQSGAGTVATTVQTKLRQQVSIFDFMSPGQIADVQAGTLTLDCTSSFNAALAASKNIYFPPGKYRFNSTITINGARGLTLRGAAAALLEGGTGYTGTTELYFSNASSGSNGIVFNDFTGVTISDMSIVMRRGGVGAGFALFMYNGHDYALENIKIDTAVNASGGGIKLGNGSGATATFIGNLRNVKCIVDGAQGAGIYWHFGTSLTAQSCYVIGGYFMARAMNYCSIISSAVDASSSFGYIIEGSNNMGLYACGCEGAQKGAFYLSTTATNIHIDAPYGADNNKSGDTLIGDLVYLDNTAGAVNSITITSPQSVAPNPGTTSNIASNAGGGFCEVLNTDATLLALGIGGNGTWLREKLTVTGYWDQFTSWTPTLVGWTNVGSPTVVGKYKRVGKIVTFYVTVTPSGGGSISSTRVTSSITGFPWNSIEIGSATMTDANTNSYGACVLSPFGILYPQTSGVLTVGLYFVGTAILP